MEGNILERIHKSALKFLVPLTTEETYKVIVNEAVKLVNGQHGSILLLKNRELVRVYSTARELYNVESGRKGPLGIKDPRYMVVDKRIPVVLTARQMKYMKQKFPGLQGFEDRAAIMIPLSYRNKSFGMLSVVALENSDFTKEQLNILKLFGSLASLGIRKTQLYDETKQALDTRDLFISLASHELRTPLTTISGYIQLLYSKLAGKETQESRWIEDLSHECLRLTKLVQELLAMNQIKSGQLQYYLKEYSLSEIVNRAVRDLSVANPDYKINFRDETSLKENIVVCDFDKLLQVLINIINNSVKFSSPERPIEVLLKKRRPYLIIKVSDFGRGISRQDLPNVFESFYKGRDSFSSGMGVGLYLAKDIIDHLHGMIRVKSKLNKGTTVDVLLPMVEDISL